MLVYVLTSSKDTTEKALCLRSFLGLAGNTELPADARLSMCRDAAALVQNGQEKRLLLGALGNIASPDSLELVQPYLDDADLKEEAATATVGIAEKLLQGADAAKVASKLVAPLEKVAKVSGNNDLTKRSVKLLEQAVAKGKP